MKKDGLKLWSERYTDVRQVEIQENSEINQIKSTHDGKFILIGFKNKIVFFEFDKQALKL
mgnify:CR=1 FL=1